MRQNAINVSSICTRLKRTKDGLNDDVSSIILYLSTAQPAYLHNLISVQSTGCTRSSSLITIARPSSSSSLKITNRSFRFGIIFRLHSFNLVRHLSPPSHHPSLPLSSIPDLKLTCSTNPSHHRSSSYPPDCPLDFNRTAFTDFLPPCVMF